MTLCIGLMSGTSADGMDACLVDISPQGIRLIDSICVDYPDDISKFLKALATSETLTAELVMGADQLIAQFAAEAANTLIRKNDLLADDIQLIGSHGHTLRHQPQPDGYSWQIGDPSYIAEYTGVTCVADFRRRDIAAGGQGAPLVPAFHRFVFGEVADTAVLNIGGIANLTILGEPLLGFDTGPGNALIDEWSARTTGQAFDCGGEYAASGNVLNDLLNSWLSNPYFNEAPPKSTGRELFNLDNLQIPADAATADIAATLTELTARSISDALIAYGPDISRLLICGGGAHNRCLMSRLSHYLDGVSIETTDAAGVPGDWMEAMAFAWLGWQTMAGLPGNCPAVTGANGLRILGGIYPAAQK